MTSSLAGIPVNLTFLVLDGRNTSTANQCTPLANVRFDTWECDYEGLYSDESSENTLGETYLRGYQLTNTSGYTQFETLYPGQPASQQAASKPPARSRAHYAYLSAQPLSVSSSSTARYAYLSAVVCCAITFRLVLGPHHPRALPPARV